MAMKEAVESTEISNPRGLPLISDFNVDPADNVTGYKSFQAGGFNFRRDEYFAHGLFLPARVVRVEGDRRFGLRRRRRFFC